MKALKGAIAQRYATSAVDGSVPDVLTVLADWQPDDQMKASFMSAQDRLVRLDPSLANQMVLGQPIVPPGNSPVQMKLAPWHLGHTEAHSVRGKSKMVNILELAVSYIESTFDIMRSPLTVYLTDAVNSPISEFAGCHLVGFGRSLAMKLLLMEICTIMPSLDDPKFLQLSALLTSLLSVNVVVQPMARPEELAFTSVRNKFQASESVRPCVLQFCRSFENVLAKQGGGSLKALIAKFNQQSSVGGQRISDLEAKVLVHLPQQTDSFREALEAHWQNFKVSESGVPLKFFSNIIGYDKVLAKSPLWSAILSPSAEKNETAILYAISIFHKSIQDAQRGMKKKINLRVNSGKFRVQDPAAALARASLWVRFRDDFRKGLQPSQFDALSTMFLRGSLDRELQQKVTLMDPEIKASDFTFLQVVTGDAPDESALESVQSKAEEGSEKSQLALFSAKLKREQAAFLVWKRSAQDFDALQKSSRAAFVQSQELKIKEQAEQAVLHQYPVKVLEESHVAPWLAACTESYAEHLGLAATSCFQIYFAHFTVLGSACLAQAPGILRVIADGLAAHPAKCLSEKVALGP